MSIQSSTRFSLPNSNGASVAAGVVAIVAFWMSGRASSLVFVPLFAMLISLFIARRFSPTAPELRSIRLSVHSVLVVATFLHAQNDVMSVVPPIALCGAAACIGEMALQCWMKNRLGGQRGEAMVLLSGIVMTAAGATFETQWLRWLAPLYFFLLLLAMRSFTTRPRQVPQQNGALNGAQNKRTLWPVALTIVVVMTGAGTHFTVWRHQNEINEWGSRFLEDKPRPESVGLSTSPSLGSTFGNEGATTRVLKAKNLGNYPYLRALAFDTYRGGRWFPLVPERRFEPFETGTLKTRIPDKTATITRLLDDNGILPIPLETTKVRIAAGANVEWARESGGPLRYSEEQPIPGTYQLQFGKAKSALASTRLSASQRERCLQVPSEIDPRIRLMTTGFAMQFSDPRERIEVVTLYLRRTHKYSLRTERGSGDPVSDFLLKKKAAHCEYFASAATILLRCMGVPTRYVVGYYAHEGNDDGDVVVRLRDAHAWAESWIDGVGWVTVEATPASGQPPQIAKKISTWQQWREALQDTVTRWRNVLLNHPRTVIGFLFGCTGVVALINAIRFLKRRTSTRSRPHYAEASPELVVVKRRFGRWMQRHGAACPIQKTWREHLSATPLPDATSLEAKRFLERYEAARFGRATDAATIAEVRAALHQLEHTPGEKS